VFVPGIHAQIVHATRRPLIVLERHAVGTDPALLARVREELAAAGHLLGLHADPAAHPACVGLAEALQRRLHADGFELSFYKLALGAPPPEPPHLDSHPELTGDAELLRLLVNLSPHPRRFLYAATDRWRLGADDRSEYAPLALPPGAERRVVAIPGRTPSTLHALRFLASAVPHVGLNDPPEHFLLSFDAVIRG
jgi:hypothetical protein